MASVVGLPEVCETVARVRVGELREMEKAEWVPAESREAEAMLERRPSRAGS